MVISKQRNRMRRFVLTHLEKGNTLVKNDVLIVL